MWKLLISQSVLMALVLMLIILVGCENEKDSIDEKQRLQPSEPAVVNIIEEESEPAILPINYESYEQTRRLVNQELDLLAWPHVDAQLVNKLLPGTIVAVEYAATSTGSDRWLFVTIPTYDCPCNNRGWIKEIDTEEITEANRMTANNGITIYIGTKVYEVDDIDPEALSEPVMIEYNMRGRIDEIRDDYAAISTGGGRTFWMRKEDIGFPVPETIKRHLGIYDKNLDSLLEAFSSVDTNAAVITYTDEELLELAEHPFHQNYDSALEHYAGKALKKEIESYQTISDTINPRTLLVKMRDHSIYKVTMEKRYAPKPFWIVTSYMDFYESGYVKQDRPYLLKSVEELPNEARAWAEKLLEEEDWEKAYITSAGSIYILIKSSSVASDSVELDGIQEADGVVTVGYQRYGHSVDELIQDYVLIEAEYGDVKEVNFVETYSSVE